MYNTDLPRRAELPTSAQLRRSCLIAAASAAVILVTIVLPSEYAIDPLGVGRMLGLTQMGEIKTQLAVESAGDKTAAAATAAPGVDAIMRRLDQMERSLTMSRMASAPAATTVVEKAVPATTEPQPALAPAARIATVAAAPAAAPATRPAATAGRNDEVSFVLTPGQGAEVKLVMRQGAKAGFAWASTGGVVNVDTHADSPTQAASYKKDRGLDRDEGVLQAAFDGNHGWFWRNRGTTNVTVTLRTTGDYIEIKRVS